jgi:arabinose-5-phosphate isomerase
MTASLRTVDVGLSQAQTARIVETGRDVIRQEAAALLQLAERIDGHFAAAIDLLMGTDGRIVVAGLGKSGHIGRKIAATLAATGSPAFFLHAAEAQHGDLGMLTAEDALIVLSKSGSTPELRPLVAHARRIGSRIIGIASRPGSPLARQSDVLLCLPDFPEACPVRIAPTSSTAMMLALGDALALALMQRRGITMLDLLQWHPGGNIGFAHAPVDMLIREEAALPIATADTPMREVVLAMTAAGKGAAGVVDGTGRLVGIITDGDLRRAFDKVLTARARDIMTPQPITVLSGTPLTDALRLMTEAKITVLFIMDREDSGRPIGLVHIHDVAGRA